MKFVKGSFGQKITPFQFGRVNACNICEQFTLVETRINKPTHTGKGPLEAKHFEGENSWIKKSHFLEHHLLVLIEKV